jgi:hypothetical protein
LIDGWVELTRVYRGKSEISEDESTPPTCSTDYTSYTPTRSIMSELIELFQFLDSPNPAARQIALTNLLGHTAKNDPERHMFIPSVTGGLGGGGLLPQKRGMASDDDERKIKSLRDLCGLCRDQPVCQIEGGALMNR